MNRIAHRLCVAIALVTAARAMAWETLAPLPEPRYSGCAVTMADKVYYLGGSVTGGVKTRTMFVYHPDRDSWSIGDSMLTARHRFGAAAIDGKIYVFGGWGNGGLTLREAECYDTASRTWTPIDSLIYGRGSLMGVGADGRAYAIGGKDAGGRLFDIVEDYDPQTGRWRLCPPMPTARCEAACGEGASYIGILGGTDQGGTVILDDIEFFDALHPAWYVQDPMPDARAAAGSHGHGRDFYIFGGFDSQMRRTNTHFQYDVHNATWTEHDPMSEPRVYLAGTGNESQLYAIGGLDSLMQPTALVERTERPLGENEDPAYRSSGRLTVSPTVGNRLFRICISGVCDASPVAVFDASGRVVARLLPTSTRTGFEATWNAREIPSGVYYCSGLSARGPALAKLIVR